MSNILEQPNAENTAKAPVGEFDPIDIEQALLSIIKKGARFEKTYSTSGVSVTFKTITEIEQAALNQRMYEIESIGEKRMQKVTRPDGISIEQEIFVHPDKDRLRRNAELLAFIKAINSDTVINESVLESYSPLLLDWVAVICLPHFKKIMLEAMKKLKAF